MARVSRHFRLGKTQPFLDFVDVDVATDTELYVDPHAIRRLRTDWGRECVRHLKSFFSAVLGAIADGDTQRADELLGELREPNETRLGLSRGAPAGHALGPELAAKVRVELQRSQAVTTRLIEDLEDTILMIPLIGRDLISDITTNVIRRPLIEYTQEACRTLGISLEPDVYCGPAWNPDASEWEQDHADLPWVGQHALLLVPKVIVRRKTDFDADDYYTKYIVPFLKEEEIRGGTELVRLLKTSGEPRVFTRDIRTKYGDGKLVNDRVTRDNPELLRSYRRDKRRHAPPPVSLVVLARVTRSRPPDLAGLLDAMLSVQPGNDGATDYHRAVEALLTPLLYPALSHLVHEAPINEGRKRIDVRFDNTATEGFFDWLGKHYRAPYIFVECKNYAEDPRNPELDQLSSRFSPRRGQFGLMVCRSISDKPTFEARCRDTADDGRGYIIGLDDADLRALVEARTSPAADASLGLLRDRFSRLVN